MADQPRERPWYSFRWWIPLVILAPFVWIAVVDTIVSWKLHQQRIANPSQADERAK